MSRKNKPIPVIFQGLEAGLKLFRWVMLALVVLFVGLGIQRVSPDSVGLLLRFGKLQGASSSERIREPGLVLTLPYPIDELIQVPVRKEGEVEVTEVWKQIGDLTALDQIDPLLEGYCLTGDNNIVQTKIVVKFRIQDPIRYRLWVDKPEGILHDAVLASLAETVAGWDVDDVRRLQRPKPGDANSTESLAQTVMARAQKRLDALEIGLGIVKLDFKEIHPPRHVVSEFRDVQNAMIEVETRKREAEKVVAELIPAAEAEATRLVQDARARVSALVSRARAEHSVFQEVYQQYRTSKNPDLIRRRLLLETFEEIVQNVGKLRLVDPESRVILADQETKETRP